MNPSAVRRTSLSIALVCASACLMYAWVVSADAQASTAASTTPVELSLASGAREFEQHCARCHTPDESAQFLRTRSNTAAAALELCAFLLEHAHIDDARSRAIVLYLDAEAKRR